MDAIIYHNPACGTSRNALALLRHAGIEPHVVDYLTTPPSAALLVQLAARISWPLADLLRERGTPFKELGLDKPEMDDAARLAAIARHPILLNRPIVITPLGVKLCRPSETVLDLLPVAPASDLDKDDGTPFLRDEPVTADDEGLREALRAAELPTQDLATSPGRFFRFATLGGTPVGHGGFERHGKDALLRSLVVAPEWRGRGIGRSIALLLMSRAFDTGARNAWLLTTSAAPFFKALGFKAVARAEAPDAIARTPQALSLCPAAASLLTRRILL